MLSDMAESVSIVFPNRDSGQADLQGETSINVYGLNRRGLVEERTLILRDLKVQFIRIKGLVSLAAASTSEQLPNLLKIIESDVGNFFSKGNVDQKYSACAQAYIEQSKPEIIRHVREIKALVVATGT